MFRGWMFNHAFFIVFSFFFPLKFPKLLRWGCRKWISQKLIAYKTPLDYWFTRTIIVLSKQHIKAVILSNAPSPLCSWWKMHAHQLWPYRIPKSVSEFRQWIDIRTLILISTFIQLLCSPDHFAKVGKYCWLSHG